MYSERDIVLRQLATLCPHYRDCFIPIGTYDDSTVQKREISNLTQTLYNNTLIVPEIVDNLRSYPCYVGFSGQQDFESNSAYLSNSIIIHAQAEDTELAVTQGYVHELVHADADRRGLVLEPMPRDSSQLIDFLVHNLMMEAAAHATEAVVIHHLSTQSQLSESLEGVKDLFDEYGANYPDRQRIWFAVKQAYADTDYDDNLSKTQWAWLNAFKAFFTAGTPLLEYYTQHYCNDFMNLPVSDHRPEFSTKDGLTKHFDHIPEGSTQALRAIMDIPGLSLGAKLANPRSELEGIRHAVTARPNSIAIDLALMHVSAQSRYEKRALQELHNQRQKPKQS